MSTVGHYPPEVSDAQKVGGPFSVVSTALVQNHRNLSARTSNSHTVAHESSRPRRHSPSVGCMRHRMENRSLKATMGMTMLDPQMRVI